ncbi:DUF58 domain-containing protein [Aureibacter tunicatorum]|uniref:Uncharacterized protein (DUF58 family) n=1 Tax=Aureibacter tunicatorum TaxID=866807 RepID=A0AAE3XN07_9BACT|nr:DUF58 domain-containing protein [Aureibacter tunicatorum]MDR6238039.1 uncharacterized protein (DUF58 family) [Aureibacter tunicatorum]
MKRNQREYPENVYTSLESLLSMEKHAVGFSLLAKKQKVKSILGGKHASKLRGRGMDFEESRKYVAGDDIRNIDWKVTARTKTTHTKVFTEEKEKPALVIVDQSNSMFFGSKVKTKAVVAAEAAALMAFRILKDGDRVGGAIFSGDELEVLKPKRDRRNALRFLEKMVQYNHKLGQDDTATFEKNLQRGIAEINNMITHDFLVVIIGDFIHYSEDLLKSLRLMSRKNDVILVRVTDPMDFILPNEDIVLSEGDKQILARGGRKELRNKLKEENEMNKLKFESMLKKYRIPVINLNTEEEVHEQVKNILTQ